jgi:hypothetical protein
VSPRNAKATNVSRETVKNIPGPRAWRVSSELAVEPKRSWIGDGIAPPVPRRDGQQKIPWPPRWEGQASRLHEERERWGLLGHAAEMAAAGDVITGPGVMTDRGRRAGSFRYRGRK